MLKKMSVNLSRRDYERAVTNGLISEPRVKLNSDGSSSLDYDVLDQDSFQEFVDERSKSGSSDLEDLEALIEY